MFGPKPTREMLDDAGYDPADGSTRLSRMLRDRWEAVCRGPHRGKIQVLDASCVFTPDDPAATVAVTCPPDTTPLSVATT